MEENGKLIESAHKNYKLLLTSSAICLPQTKPTIGKPEMWFLAGSGCCTWWQPHIGDRGWLTLKRTLLVESELASDFSDGELRPTNAVTWLPAMGPLALYMAELDSKDGAAPDSEVDAAGTGRPPSARLVCFSLHPAQICTMPRHSKKWVSVLAVQTPGRRVDSPCGLMGLAFLKTFMVLMNG